tara:strand:- start:57 stop:461 length:405 start_codon:yes stop_codon:yes gene_type:complete
MGRIERQKRQLIEEANKRNLGNLNENYKEYEDEADDAAQKIHGLSNDINDLRGRLEDEIMDDEENSEDLDLNNATDSLYDAERALGDATFEVDGASSSIENFLSNQDEDDEDEDDEDNDMDKHLRDRDGGMGSL